MKKGLLYIKLALLSTVLLSSCITRNWDPAEDLRDLTKEWAYKYVDDALRLAIDSSYSLSSYYYPQTVGTSVLKDTLSMDFVYRYSQSGDSINVSSVLRQIKDSIVVATDGYIYADKFWVHLFTADSGIINYEGVFHVDFYETGQTAPWGWSEIRYRKPDKENSYSDYKYFKKDEIQTGWY